MSDIQEPTEQELIQQYAWTSGNRTNDLRIALRNLSTVRLLLNKPANNYSNAELHPLTEQVDKIYEQLENEMWDSNGPSGQFAKERIMKDRAISD